MTQVGKERIPNPYALIHSALSIHHCPAQFLTQPECWVSGFGVVLAFRMLLRGELKTTGDDPWYGDVLIQVFPAECMTVQFERELL
jgi:hypothetical protein